jgi:hypothetical protein
MIRRGTFAAEALVWLFIPVCAGSSDAAAPTAIAQGSTGPPRPRNRLGRCRPPERHRGVVSLFGGAREGRGNSQTQFSTGSSFSTLSARNDTSET